MPPTIDLVRVNSRLTVFGLIGGTIIGGGIAAGVEFVFTKLFHLPGALFVIVVVTVVGAYLSMQIPRWVEVTTGEVPTTLTYHGRSGPLRRDSHGDYRSRPQRTGRPRQPLGRNIITSLWGNVTIKVMVGFLFLYPAFVAKQTGQNGWHQVAMLGMIGAAATVGNFAGNGLSARLKLGHPSLLVVRCAIMVTASALAAAFFGDLIVMAIAALITSGCSAVGKASLDACLQDDLPEQSRASAFGRSESLLQLAWVAGGATGVLVYTDLRVGFTAISSFLILGLAQTIVSYRGDSLIPGFGGNRPVVAEQEGRAPDGAMVTPSETCNHRGWRLSSCWCAPLWPLAFGCWCAISHRSAPEISAYSRGQLARVGPYTLLQCAESQTTARTTRPRAHSPSTSATRCSCRCPARSAARRGCCGRSTTTRATPRWRSSGRTADWP